MIKRYFAAECFLIIGILTDLPLEQKVELGVKIIGCVAVVLVAVFGITAHLAKARKDKTLTAESELRQRIMKEQHEQKMGGVLQENLSRYKVLEEAKQNTTPNEEE